MASLRLGGQDIAADASTPASYSAITPARDEAVNLRHLAEVMVSQSLQPLEWVIVENGSVDGTADLAAELAGEHPWISVVNVPGSRSYDRWSPYIDAVHAGYAALTRDPAVLVKLDADVSFDDDFFASLVDAFALDPLLGIASGSCWEQDDGGGPWRRREIRGDHVWGPTRAYRWPEMRFLFPLDASLGYAAVDETKARLQGWKTRTLPLRFDHHRPEGHTEGSRMRAWMLEGRASHYLAYRPTYALARTAFHIRRDIHSVGLPVGYLGAKLRRQPQLQDNDVRRALRRQQRLRNVRNW